MVVTSGVLVCIRILSNIAVLVFAINKQPHSKSLVDGPEMLRHNVGCDVVW